MDVGIQEDSEGRSREGERMLGRVLVKQSVLGGRRLLGHEFVPRGSARLFATSAGDTRKSSQDGEGRKTEFPVVMTGIPADGKQVEKTLGLVTSTSVMSRNIFVDVFMAVLGVMGGPAVQYEELVSEAVVRATDGVATAAQKMDADQVINFRIEKAVIVNRLVFGVYVFVTAYGTAVRVK